MIVARTLRSLIGLVVLSVGVYATTLSAEDPESPSPSSTTSATGAPLSSDQVVDSLVRKNQERAQALLHSEATRVYRLVYHGFPGDRSAEMTIEASYSAPATKNFKIVSQSGSKLVLDRVFKKLLDSEKEAAQPAISVRSQLNRDNYDFELVGYDSLTRGGQYVLQVNPKAKSKYVYRGKVWVDGTDFAVTRIDAEPALNPSFWTKNSRIHHEYVKVEGFWLPARNESVSYIRMGGQATLTIEYQDYRVIDGRKMGSPSTGSSQF